MIEINFVVFLGGCVFVYLFYFIFIFFKATKPKKKKKQVQKWSTKLKKNIFSQKNIKYNKFSSQLSHIRSND